MPGWGDKSDLINTLYQKGKKVNKNSATKKDSPDTNAGKSPTVGQNPTSLPSETNPSITNNIPESSAKINDNTEISDEPLHKYVTEMREKQFTDDDILAQFEKMGVNPQKAFEAADNTNTKKYKKQITEELGDSDFLEGSPTIHQSMYFAIKTA